MTAICRKRSINITMRMKYINKILDYTLFAVLSVMATVMATNVFCRFLLKFSIYWADELAQSLLVWLTFLGAAVAIRESSHYSFDAIQNKIQRQEPESI